MLLLLELNGNEVHVEYFLLLLGWVKVEVLTICHSLAEARDDNVQDNVDKVVVCHFGIDIESMDIIQVSLDNTCFLEIMLRLR